MSLRRLAALVVVALLSTEAAAAIRFELPHVYAWAHPGQPTTGAFDILVRADAGDLPQQVSAFNVDVTVAAAAVTLGPPQPAPSPLLAGLLLDQSPNPQTLRASREIFPSSAPLVDGAGLVRVPFSIPAGITGSYLLSFGNLNELANPSAEEIPTDVTGTGLLVVASAGDFDRNGAIDGADFLVWQRTLGQSAAPIGSGADANRDGLIAAADLLAWRANYGTLALSAAAAVPEPTAAALAAVTTALLAGIHRRRP